LAFPGHSPPTRDRSVVRLLRPRRVIVGGYCACPSRAGPPAPTRWVGQVFRTHRQVHRSWRQLGRWVVGSRGGNDERPRTEVRGPSQVDGRYAILENADAYGTSILGLWCIGLSFPACLTFRFGDEDEPEAGEQVSGPDVTGAADPL
jgi:hypothetical protein